MALITENLSHSFPIDLLVSLLSLLLFFLTQEVGLFLQGWISKEILIVQSFFSSVMEILQDITNIIHLNVRHVWILLFLWNIIIVFLFLSTIFTIFAFLSCFLFFNRLRGRWLARVALLISILSSKSCCFFISFSLLFLLTKLIESLNKKLNIFHWVNSKGLSNGINHDQELFLWWFIGA